MFNRSSYPACEPAHGRACSQQVLFTTIRINQRNYRLSRLKRDAPCYAERFASGEFRSVSAAVKAAVADGAISWGIGKTLDQQLIALWKKASRDEQSAFLAWMRENTTDS